jgi:dTDP-4-amino-4,6-dideoxygalactose transaminase
VCHAPLKQLVAKTPLNWDESHKTKQAKKGLNIMIPILVPNVPSTDAILPYLRRIDLSRVYSNAGPLHTELVMRIAKHFEVDSSMVAILANATLALEGAISTAPTRNRLWESPSWTFTATPAALLNAGADILFADVDNEWRVSPNYVSGNVVDVLPFGKGENFERLDLARLNCLVVDAAASFDSLTPLRLPTTLPTVIVISMHATKVFPAGEGGIIISNDAEWIQRIRKWSNFGMGSDRISELVGTNAKLSEYGSAVGLATLDSWQKIRRDFDKISLRILEVSERLQLNNFTPCGNSISSYWILRDLDPSFKSSISNVFKDRGIATRDWWESGCHKMPAYSEFLQEKNSLERTEHFAATSLGLPFFAEMTQSQLDEIEQALIKAKDNYLSNCNKYPL